MHNDSCWFHKRIIQCSYCTFDINSFNKI